MSTSTTAKAARRCCGSSVGVIITGPDERLLMVTRAWHPVGIAPVAGHVWDEHASVAEALAAEVREEVGLTVTRAELVTEALHLPNLCASLPAQPRPGHTWWVYTATATGDLRPDTEETKGAAWYSRAAVQELAARTLAYGRGRIGRAAYEAAPGLEAVWVRHLADAGIITATAEDLAIAEALYSTPPEAFWSGV